MRFWSRCFPSSIMPCPPGTAAAACRWAISSNWKVCTIYVWSAVLYRSHLRPAGAVQLLKRRRHARCPCLMGRFCGQPPTLLLGSTSWKMYDFSVSFTSMTMEYWDKKLSLFSALYRPGESIVLNRHFPPRLRPLDGSCYSRQSHHSLRNRHRCTVHGQAPSPAMRVWGDNTFTLYPFQAGIPYYFVKQ